tara:strand:+ start:741 stop:1439 length:699 start_codon:yes stop_codon:yes gene_type:complete
MILVFPQATKKFNDLYQEMLKESCINDFLDISLGSYDLKTVKKVVIILLENDVVEKHLNNYLNACEKINNFQIVKLKKETSGAICTTLMAIPILKNKTVIISALDQILLDKKLDFSNSLLRTNVDMLAPTHKSDNPSLCYILKDDEDQVIQLFEKRLVSNEALLGIYIVKDFSEFYKNCHELLIKYKGFKDRIFYTSDVINNYIGKNMICEFPRIDTNYYKIRTLKDFKVIK